jgi:release factor glutamine methyltransferase
MKNSKVLFDDFVKRIRLNETQDEICTMAYLTFEKYLGLSRMDVLLSRNLELTSVQEAELLKAIERINRNEPIQYILGEADFYGRKFLVDNSVLIPRPETEELVRFIIDYAKKNNVSRVIDIGTGSGCIPITLALELKGSEVFATDVSFDALEVAVQNMKLNKTRVTFVRNDILTQSLPFSSLDVIVSNPPYITKQEIPFMRDNVVKFEPHLALFVPDNDPFVFYRSIIVKSKQALRSGGLLAFEINERYGKEIADLMQQNGFASVQVINDLSGKNRIVAGTTGNVAR